MSIDSEGNNVATLYTKTGYSKYHAFCAKVEEWGKVCYETAIITDDEESQDGGNKAEDDKWFDEEEETPSNKEKSDTQIRSVPISMHINVNEGSNIIMDEEDREPDNKQAEYLRWHYRLGHLSPKKMKQMAHQGRLPSWIKQVSTPMPLWKGNKATVEVQTDKNLSRGQDDNSSR